MVQASITSTEEKLGPYAYCHSLIYPQQWIKYFRNVNPERMYLKPSTNYFLPLNLAFIHYTCS